VKDVKGIGVIELSEKDVIRHKLIRDIIEAYEKDSSSDKKA